MEPTLNPAPGPRQTVAKVLHPTRGEGWLVRDNGPSLLHFPGADGVPVRQVAMGSNADTGSYVCLRAGDEAMRMQVLDHGERHSRMWSPILGSGWLVWERGAGLRFEADDNRVQRWTWKVISVGTPDYFQRQERTKRDLQMTDEERNWTTFVMRDGTVLGLRHDGPPPERAPAAEPTGDRQMQLPGT